MHDKVTFYYNPMSRGRIAHWMLEEIGAEYETKLFDWKSGAHKSPEYLKINPMGKIPAITHRGMTVTETAAICMYLADAFPAAGLAPAPTDAARGAYYRWFMFAVGCVEPALIDMNYPRLEPAPAASQLAYGDFKTTIDVLEKAVSKGFLAGGKFSALDLYMSSLLAWAMGSLKLEARPAFKQYVKLCNDRPGFKKFMEKAGPLG